MLSLYTRLRNHIQSVDSFELISTLTIIIGLAYFAEDPLYKVGMAVFAVASVVYAPIKTSFLFWTALAAYLTFMVTLSWETTTSDLYLYVYWCIALAVTRLSINPKRVLSIVARYMIALVFLFSFFWKITSPDFATGNFFRFSFALDARLAPVAILLTPMTMQDFLRNRKLASFSNLVNGNKFKLFESNRTRVLSQVLAVTTLFIELLIGLAFVASWRKLRSFGDGLLLLFLLTTYTVAPITRFGALLACIGFSQAEDHAYKSLFILAILWIQLSGLWQVFFA